MHGKVLFIFLIVPLIDCHDVAIGLNNYGKKIFEEERQASPAIWRQKENVTIGAAEGKVVTKVIIIDMRPEKDGEAYIVDGGEGKKNVTIELKSPTVLRGYDFFIEVFSAPDIQNDNETTQTSSPLPPDCNNQASTVPQQVSNSADSTRLVRTTDEENNTNNEGSTLHTSVINSTSSTTLNIGKDNPTLPGMETNETNYTEDESTMSTTSATETTTIEYATIKNDNVNGKDIPDFSDMIGFNDDETRHAREAKDFETTSTAIDSTTELTTETPTGESNMENISTQDVPVLNMEVNNTRFPRESTEQDTSTEINITERTTDLITILSPESENAKAVQDLTDIRGMEPDETTQNSEQNTSTGGDVTEIATESTTITADDTNQNFNIAEDARHAREAQVTTTTVSDSSTNMDLLTPTITEDYSGDGSDDLSYLNTKEETANNATTEENSLHVDLTPPNTDTSNNPLYIFGDRANTDFTLNSQDSSAIPPMVNQPITNGAEEQVLRNSRNTAQMFGNMVDPSSMINDPNYPLLVSPSLQDSEPPISESGYVYVPLIAIVSNSSFPTFQSALESLMQQSKTQFQTPN